MCQNCDWWSPKFLLTYLLMLTSTLKILEWSSSTLVLSCYFWLFVVVLWLVLVLCLVLSACIWLLCDCVWFWLVVSAPFWLDLITAISAVGSFWFCLILCGYFWFCPTGIQPTLQAACLIQFLWDRLVRQALQWRGPLNPWYLGRQDRSKKRNPNGGGHKPNVDCPPPHPHPHLHPLLPRPQQGHRNESKWQKFVLKKQLHLIALTSNASPSEC